MSRSLLTFWRESASGSRTGVAESLFVLFLAPLALLYSSAQRLRAGLYHMGLLKTERLPRPVVSIGNITVGGTGKTPVTAYIARFLLARGYRVAVLSRGYGGSLEGQTCVVSDGETIMLSAVECGDEPYMLASTVPGLIVVMGTDRYEAGRLAMQQLVPDIFLLDDGFQHLRLHRNLNILLVDFARPFGNGWTLPCGLLREPASAARRAGLLMFTRAPEEFSITDTAGGTPTCISRHTLIDLLPMGGTKAAHFSEYREYSILACAGIADPESFFSGLRTAGLNLARTISFPDHAEYNQERCNELAKAMQDSGADFLVTTEKDGVKLKGLSKECAGRTLLARLELKIDNPATLEMMLTALLEERQAK